MSAIVFTEGMRMSMIERAEIEPIRSGVGRHGVSVTLRWDEDAETIRRGAFPMDGMATVMTVDEARRLVAAIEDAIAEAVATAVEEAAGDDPRYIAQGAH